MRCRAQTTSCYGQRCFECSKAQPRQRLDEVLSSIVIVVKAVLRWAGQGNEYGTTGACWVIVGYDLNKMCEVSLIACTVCGRSVACYVLTVYIAGLQITLRLQIYGDW
jgi:hypothetical protein